MTDIEVTGLDIYPLGSADNYPGIFGGFTLMLLMWTLAGVLLPPLLTAVKVSAAGAVVARLAIWGIVRDMPVRPKVA